MRNTKAAIRYAKALIELANEQGAVNACFEDMELVRKTVLDNRELGLLLKSPIVNSDKKEAILKSIFEGKVSGLTSQFMLLITRKGREGLLGEIADAYVQMVKETKNIQSASVITATPLTDDLRSELLSLVKGWSKGEVELTETVDPEILGGFVLKVNDRMVDASVSTKFRQLRRTFAERTH
jgi:F-type H+-transporting ATPase subunit delta